LDEDIQGLCSLDLEIQFKVYIELYKKIKDFRSQRSKRFNRSKIDAQIEEKKLGSRRNLYAVENN